MSSKKLDAAYEATKDTTGRWVNPVEITGESNFSRRHEEPKAKDAVVALAASIYHEGQQTPAVVRQVGDRLVLVGGFTRRDAVNLIRAGFEYQGERLQDADRKLWVTVNDKIKSDKDAAIASVLENVRREVSPINVAEAQRELIDTHGLNLTEVARLYGYSNTNAVSANKKLLELSAEEQKLVHTGKLSRDAAIKLQQLPEEQKAALIAEAKDGKVTAAVVTEKIAENREGATESTEAAEESTEAAEEKNKYAPRNAAALKKFIAEEVIGNDDIPATVQATFAAISKYLEGRNTGKAILNRINAINAK